MDDLEQHHLIEKRKTKYAKIICNDETFIGYKMS